ncbi:polymorphic toxin-type HINT domain-containing protein [Nocardioides sp. NPDC057772]|uniref:polymorphic toxin-type HINT domain-containing protein n=1 Tax=Nocardioides sp. NPDC057772 TaxID=3346245 RepID=UPI00366C6E44
MVKVRLADGTTIDATDEHPFWVEGEQAWVDAIDLEPGDVLIEADGDKNLVFATLVTEQDLTAYNFTVEDLHTYFVGVDDVLVHNAGACPAFGIDDAFNSALAPSDKGSVRFSV